MKERWVMERVNRMVYLISIFIGLALCGGYYFDYVSSEVPPLFFFAFVGIVAAQQVCNAVVYFGDKGSANFKYVALIGYFAMYFIAMFGRVDALFGLNEDSIALYIYVVIIPLMILYIGYFDLTLIKIMAIGTVVANVAKVMFHISIGYISDDDISEYMVQMGCIIIAVVSVYTVAKISFENHMKKLKDIESAARQAELARHHAEAVAAELQSSIRYASKIQRNLLPPAGIMAGFFTDCSIIWKPRDIVGGDVYWVKAFDEGVVLCVADCTGHGTPGALLTTLVTSALESIVHGGNYYDTADIIWRLDQRLSSVLHVDDAEAPRGLLNIFDGCDIAVLFITNKGTVKFSSGNIPVFVCDGKAVTQYKGQKLFIGEGKLKSRDETNVTCIPANPANKFYIASDGLFDQIGKRSGSSSAKGIQFGYDSFKDTVLKHHAENLSEITGKVWDEYESYRGDEARRDDFELIAFKP